MQRERLRELLDKISAGTIDVADALEQIGTLSYDDLGFALVDTHRSVRVGFPEVIFCSGKTVKQVSEIARSLSVKNDTVIATRASSEIYEACKALGLTAAWLPEARIVLIGKKRNPVSDDQVLVISAGTADLPVAEEAAATAEIMGNRVERLFDAGVAGIHRILNNLEKIRRAGVLIVVAGMDGALPSVVGGLVKSPVIAVPTSIGYGAGAGGIAPLLTMLNSCAPGVTVVNIDNGFGAGYAASTINRRGH